MLIETNSKLRDLNTRLANISISAISDTTTSTTHVTVNSLPPDDPFNYPAPSVPDYLSPSGDFISTEPTIIYYGCHVTDINRHKGDERMISTIQRYLVDLKDPNINIGKTGRNRDGVDGQLGDQTRNAHNLARELYCENFIPGLNGG